MVTKCQLKIPLLLLHNLWIQIIIIILIIILLVKIMV